MNNTHIHEQPCCGLWLCPRPGPLLFKCFYNIFILRLVFEAAPARAAHEAHQPIVKNSTDRAFVCGPVTCRVAHVPHLVAHAMQLGVGAFSTTAFYAPTRYGVRVEFGILQKS